MAAITTLGASQAHRPDIITVPFNEAIPDSLFGVATTLVTSGLEGDAPVARIPWINDADADFVAEGTSIDEADPVLGETTVGTRKIAQLVRLSREQYRQSTTASLLSTSMSRAVTARANQALIQETDAATGLVGLANTSGIITGGAVAANLDPVVDTLAQVQANGATAPIILASPTGWAGLRKIKTQDGSALGVLGAGASDAAPILLGCPVTVTNAVPDGKLLIVDPTVVASAVSPVSVATSEDAYFSTDSIGVRITWRLGWKVMKANRLGLLTVGAGAGS